MRPNCSSAISFGKVLGLVVLAALGAAPPLAAEELRAVPRLASTRIPEPPEQRTPWAPPRSDLPESLITAASVLFEQGVADPRGCEYRAIEIVTSGSSWLAPVQLTNTFGWLLPARPDERQRFAVCWNGLVYPVVSVGKPADVSRQMGAAIDEFAKNPAGSRGAASFGIGAYGLLGDVSMDRRSTLHNTLDPLKACLLLRLGHTVLAKRLWDVWQLADAPVGAETGGEGKQDDPYLLLAANWAWDLFDRAIHAHIVCDDNLALASATELVRIRPLIQAEAKRRGFSRDKATTAGYDGKLSFLDSLDSLMADQRRRADHVHAGSERKQSSSRNAHIRHLIANLENLRTTGNGVACSPTVKSLIAQRDMAVKPLLECLESDTRLTRTTHQVHYVGEPQTVITVAEAAYVAISWILQKSFVAELPFGERPKPLNAEGLRLIATDVRAYWNANRDLPLEERWLRTLADCSATQDEWLEAANNILRTDERPFNLDGAFPGGRTGILMAPKTSPFRGEPLRKKSAPSVSDLLTLRVLRSDSPDRAFQFAMLLNRWDPQASRPVLRRQLRRCLASSEPWSSYFRQPEARKIVDLTLALAEAGDPDVLREYTAWFRGFAGQWTVGPPVYAPLWRFPNEPSIKAALAWMFEDPRSPWSWKSGAPFNVATYEVTHLPILATPELSGFLLGDLEDTTPLGVITVPENGVAESRWFANVSPGCSRNHGDPAFPKVGVKLTFRVCDVRAQSLGIVPCELYWPNALRDDACRCSAERLRRFAARLAYTPEALWFKKVPSHTYHDPRSPLMTFPALDHPATPEDVQQGRAIFSLAGQGEVRRWPMPQPALLATWKVPRGDARQKYVSDINPKWVVDAADKLTGYVWQAEEVRSNRRWERYYGFVGPLIAQVPAAEIEFPQWPGQVLPDGFTVHLDTDGRLSDMSDYAKPLTLDDPLAIKIKVANRRGAPAAIPKEYLSVNCTSGEGSDPGLTLSMKHLPKGPAAPVYFNSTDAKAWPYVRAKPGSTAISDGPGRPLDSIEEFAVGSFKLADWFDIESSCAGSFLLIGTVQEKGQPARNVLWAAFELSQP